MIGLFGVTRVDCLAIIGSDTAKLVTAHDIEE
jgi:hypothetical protein